MLPKTHIIFGALFTGVVFLFVRDINYYYLGLIFLSSFLIDFDHYVASVLKTREISLRKSLRYHDELMKTEIKEKKKGIRRRGDFHLFHTVEFHALIGLLGLIWIGFFYIFIGMIFHSLLDVFSLTQRGILYRREYFLTNWVAKMI